ncbi:hypothetical protein [Legionella tucsonensis]|uniref:Uncharacterized protein n=1 Tax=Legionella tucsonensis TaxID=40335 RepID=A0A0W0ZW68_9GAMM|nr:hypothetical protein [Legionella tucsonensis]KTD73238.1 hypothetical protein Ltuc_1085 [Legionella tucsonensis]
MYIRIFDFDQTITKHHTFQRPELFNSDNNIKTGIGEFFLHDKENVSVVATYHDNPEYVKSYIEKILNKKLTLQNTIDYKNDRLSVYTCANEKIPVLISTIPPENYNSSIEVLMTEGKNTQIMHILDYLKNNHDLNYKRHEIHLYEDSDSNILEAEKLTREISKIICHLINKYKPNQFSIKSIKESTLENKIINTKANGELEIIDNSFQLPYERTSNSISALNAKSMIFTLGTPIESEYRKKAYLLFKSIPKESELYEAIWSIVKRFTMATDDYLLYKGVIEVDKYDRSCQNDQERRAVQFLLNHKEFNDFVNVAKTTGLAKIVLENLIRAGFNELIEEQASKPSFSM